MFAFAIEWLRTNLKKDEGQTMAEYGIILAVVVVVVAAVLVTLATGISGTISNVVSKL